MPKAYNDLCLELSSAQIAIHARTREDPLANTAVQQQKLLSEFCGPRFSRMLRSFQQLVFPGCSNESASCNMLA